VAHEVASSLEQPASVREGRGGGEFPEPALFDVYEQERGTGGIRQRRHCMRASDVDRDGAQHVSRRVVEGPTLGSTSGRDLDHLDVESFLGHLGRIHDVKASVPLVILPDREEGPLLVVEHAVGVSRADELVLQLKVSVIP
jgi:hypothetical protein